MTNREFFIETLESEVPKFAKVLGALPVGKLDWKPAEKGRSMGRVAYQLACQPVFILGILKNGTPDWADYVKTKEHLPLPEMLSLMEKRYADLLDALAKFPDADWETGKALLEFPGGKWETKKYDMAWGFLFDAIHHRGQLTTYLRVLGEKVPGVYGGSADEQPNP